MSDPGRAAHLALQRTQLFQVLPHQVRAVTHERRELRADPALVAHAAKHRALAGYSNEAAADPATLLAQKCDILVPAAMERVIDGGMAARLQCRVLAEGANGPTTPDADRVLEQRQDITVIPDILCNAGGVIVSYFEWVQDLQQFFWEEDEVNTKLRQVLDKAFNRTFARVEKDKVSERTAAMAIGVERVRDAKIKRGLFP